MTKSDIIPNLNKPVIFDGSEYIFKAYQFQLSERDGSSIHLALLLDKNEHSWSYIPLEKCEREGGKMMNDKLKYIAYHYGKQKQLEHTEKELIELADVINHFLEGKATLSELIDETADTIVMIKQDIYLLDIEDEVSDRAAYKLIRQIERIKAEDKKNEAD